MTLRAYAADFVFTAVPGEPLLRQGAIVLDEAARVVTVGDAASLRQQHTDAQWSDVSGLLMPGLVNAHAHLELSALRGHTRSGGGFGPWASSMMDARQRLLPEQDFEAVDAAVGELLRTGTAAVGEVTNSLATLEALSSAPLLGCIFHEVFGLRREVGETMRAMAEQRRASVQHWPANLAYSLAPHTLYSLHPDVVRAIVHGSRERGTLTSLHLAEHAAERAFLADGSGPFAAFLEQRAVDPPDWPPPGLDPIRYAEQLDVLGPGVLAVHLADARPEEIARVGESGASVVLCPRSNLFIELKLPPLNLLLDAGIIPALGTDSLASNTTLDVLAEAAALRDRFPMVDALQLLRMATYHGAKALGLSHRLGALSPGLSPGLVQLSCPKDASDPAAHVLRYHSEPRHVLARPALPDVQRPLEASP